MGEDGAVLLDHREKVAATETWVGHKGVVIPNSPSSTEEARVIGVNAPVVLTFLEVARIPGFVNGLCIEVVTVSADIARAIRNDIGVRI